MKDRNGVDPDVRVGEERLGGVEKWESMTRINYVSKKYIFNKRKTYLLIQK